jgi:hypothetical protein
VGGLHRRHQHLRGPDDQDVGIVLAQGGRQVVRREVGEELHAAADRFELLDARPVELVRDQDGHRGLPWP